MTTITKQPSQELTEMVNDWADGYIKSTELPIKILEAAEKEGLSKQEIRKIVEDALLKRGLSDRRIREVLPAELKDSTKIHPSTQTPRRPSAAKPIDKTKELEDELKRQKEIAEQKAAEAAEEKRRRLQLEDALHQTEQFVSANKLDDEGAKIEEEYKKETAQINLTDPKGLIEKAVLTEENIFETLKKQADGIHTFWYDAYGIDLFKNRELAQLKNSGVKTFKRLYFEV